MPMGTQPKGVRTLLRLLNHAKAPTVLGLIVGSLLMTLPMEPSPYAKPRYLFAEVFAGIAAVTSAFKDAGHPAVVLGMHLQ